MRRMLPRPRRLAGLVLGLTFLTACGTTVPTNQLVSAGPSDESGLGGASSSQVPSGQAPAGSTAGGSPSGVVGTGGQTSTSGSRLGASQPSVTAGGSTSLANGPGVTATTITLGVTYYQSAKTANAALGASNLYLGDPVAGTRVLVKAINASGGIAGRKLEVLFYAIDPQSSQPYSASAQALCTYFTQDHKVLAVLNGTPAADASACLAQRGVAVLGAAIITPHLATNELGAYTVSMARAYTALVPELSGQGWFSGWNRLTAAPGTAPAKTGVVTTDDHYTNAAIDGVLLPSLKRAGYAPDPSDVIRITPPGGFGDDGAVVAAIQNAVLKFNADGVDHVILDDGNGSLTLLFQNNAYSQGYFPRYGGTSGDAWQVLLSAHDIQAKTLQGAIGIGTQPLFDLPYAGQDGPDSNNARRKCFAIFRGAGMAHTDDSTAGGQAEGCDVAFLLQAAFKGWNGALTLDTLLARVAALGTRYPLASGFSSSFVPGQRDGAGGFKAMRFDNGCGCIQYVGGVRAL
jgi:hypothetical protein